MLRSPPSVTQSSEPSLADLMTRGGDARIVLSPETGLNRYFSAPFPRDILAFASSTANDLSEEAYTHLNNRFAGGTAYLESGPGYDAFLEELRGEVRTAYGLSGGVDVFFAPSGTDLEYVGLLAVAGRRRGGIANFLLGADEVGSGCIHSAAGLYFANETALDVQVTPQEPVAGLPPVTMSGLGVRCEKGAAHASSLLAAEFERGIVQATADEQFPLIHVVHGSKTGLVLPHLEDIDRLRGRFGEDVAFVVDACQARITPEAVQDYLRRGIIVFLTGSKFMGGPPFSGFALIPEGWIARCTPIAPGMANIFRRAEIPQGWPGRETCSDSGNTGLALRLTASLFELRRFHELDFARVERVVDAFTTATDRLAADLGIRKVASAPEEDADEPAEHPIEMLTLVTLDLCHSAGGRLNREMDFDTAGAIHRELINQGIRLGQPVRCVRLPDGNWGATLRIGLSMPQITRLNGLSDATLDVWMSEAMNRIAGALAPLLDC